MFAPPVMQQLAGERLHLSHGPIDVVLNAWGSVEAVRAAYAAVRHRFPQILPELCDELALLRTPMHEEPRVAGPVARRMAEACRPFVGIFVTPMAAVAGAVADELLAHMTAAAPLNRAFVNDGGDIAVLVSPGHALDVGIAGEYSRGATPLLNGALRLDAASGVGGIATSGARGRSFSLGIADSVTIAGTRRRHRGRGRHARCECGEHRQPRDPPPLRSRPRSRQRPARPSRHGVRRAADALRDRRRAHRGPATRGGLLPARTDRRRRPHACGRDAHTKRRADSLSPLFSGERVRVRGGHKRWSKRLPLTLSPHCEEQWGEGECRAQRTRATPWRA